MSLTPLTPRQVKNAVDRAKNRSPVESVIAHLNALLSNPKTKPTNAMYQMTNIPVKLTVEEMVEVHAKLLAANWKSAQVVVWQGTVAVTLDATAVRNWECAYEGKKLSQLTNSQKRTRKKAA